MKPLIPFNTAFTLADARQHGISRATVRGWMERGEVRRIAHGLFLPAHVQDDAVRTSRAITDGSIATSYIGAASVHGLLLPPHPHPPWRRPIRLQRIPDAHRWRTGRVLLSSPAWTALTLALHQPLPSALVPLDSALRRGVTRAALEECLQRMTGRPGSSVLHRAIEHADPRSESALESLARGAFILAGLPMPVLQAEVLANRRRYRLDFLWPAQRLVLETDGLVKYDGQQDLHNEKRRHNDLVAAGYTVLRCGFTNVYPRADILVAQLRRLLTT